MSGQSIKHIRSLFEAYATLHPRVRRDMHAACDELAALRQRVEVLERETRDADALISTMDANARASRQRVKELTVALRRIQHNGRECRGHDWLIATTALSPTPAEKTETKCGPCVKRHDGQLFCHECGSQLPAVEMATCELVTGGERNLRCTEPPGHTTPHRFKE